MIDINKFLIENQSLINVFAYKYHHNFNYDDFRQELMIDVWHYMEKYDPDICPNPQHYLFSAIDILSKRVLSRLSNNKSQKLNDSFLQIIEDSTHALSETSEVDTSLASLIETQLTDVEKKIVYALDYEHKSHNTYINIAKRIGIPSRMVYYHIKNIRKKLKKDK